MQRHCVWILAAGFSVFTATARAENVILVKAGNYSLNDNRQSITTNWWPSSELTIEEDATLVGLEYEWRFKNGFSIGGEYAESTHSYVERTAFGTVATGDLGQFTLTVNGKKYFKVTDWFLPYVGIGIGWGGVVLDESGTDNDNVYIGLAAQALAGAEFRFGRVGVYTGAKLVSSEVEDGEDTIDISGTAYLGGVTIHF